MGRFGKSMTADMMTAYYSKGYNSEKMFSNLAISKSCDFHKHLNKYDVIHLDIQWCIEPAGGSEKVVSYIYYGKYNQRVERICTRLSGIDRGI